MISDERLTTVYNFKELVHKARAMIAGTTFYNVDKITMPIREYMIAELADALQQADALLEICRTTPRAEDAERIGELEAALSEHTNRGDR